MGNFLAGLLDWIYKKKCYFCSSSKQGVKMCSDCYEELEHFAVGENREYQGVKIFCAGEYESNLQKLIRGLKYHNQRELAYYQAKFMFAYWQNVLDKKANYQVVPVPLYKAREKARRYNHMALVVDEFCKISGYEPNYDLVKRVKDTKPQYKLTKNQRMDNLANAFLVDRASDKKLPVLILDDICTTGATFESIIQELKKCDIMDVVCFAATTPL